MRPMIRGLVTGVSAVVLALASAGAAVAMPDLDNRNKPSNAPCQQRS